MTTDATFTTGPVALTAAGCYAWTDVLSGTFPGVVTIPPGSAGEVTQISLHQPSLVTQAAVTSGNGGSQSLGDSITATNSGIGEFPGSPASAQLAWSLLGPVVPIGSTCSSVSWTGVATLATGGLTVTGDGLVTMPLVPITTPGCYSFTETLAATSDSNAATTTPGAPT